MRLLTDIVDNVTDTYLNKLDKNNPPEYKQIENDITNATIAEIIVENSTRDRYNKLPIRKSAYASQIAKIMAFLHPFCNINHNDRTKLAMYISEGPKRGLYTINKKEIKQTLLKEKPLLSTHKLSEIYHHLETIAPLKTYNPQSSYIFTENGIYDKNTATYLDFTPNIILLTTSQDISFDKKYELITAFMDDILPQVKWDLLPYKMLYQMFGEWLRQNNKTNLIKNKPEFIDLLLLYTQKHKEWSQSSKDKTHKGAARMTVCEPLLEIYHLIDWQNPDYASDDTALIVNKCTPKPNQYYQRTFRGLIRTSSIKQP